MPTYDYECAACNQRFEQYQSITAKHLRKCPGCGRLRLTRLLGTGAGVLFKGSGFHETDYRSEGYKKAVKAEQDSTKKSDSSTQGDGGTKPDAPGKSQAASTPGGSDNAGPPKSKKPTGSSGD